VVLAPFRYLRRHPGRALAWLTLLGLTALVWCVLGILLWSEYHLRAARRAVARGHNIAAVHHLRACRQVRPDDREVLLLSARVARRGGGWNEAEVLLNRYWQLYGDEEPLVLERLLLRATRGELEGVQPLLQDRIDQDDPAAPLAREALIAGLLYRYRPEEAERQIESWLEREPDSTQAWLARAKLYELREQNSDALLAYRRILELDPEQDQSRLRMTTILVELRQGEEALPHLEYLRRRLPDNAEVQVQLGTVLESVGRVDEARAVLDECLGSHPRNAAALAERGRIARRDGEGDRAEEYLRRAIQLDPGNVSAHYQYYLTLNQNGKKAEAAQEEQEIRRIEADVQHIKELIQGRLQVAPNDPAAHYEVAMIALRAGRPKEALRWLQSALQVGPDHLPTHRALAAYYRETGNPILANHHRAIAQRLSSQQPPEGK
jgi:tetratricopeptide (TPR) repeat protein